VMGHGVGGWLGSLAEAYNGDCGVEAPEVN
jgi:hypothetical protein